MKLAVLLVALGALLCIGVEVLLALFVLGPLFPTVAQRQGTAFGVYLVALVLALTSAILSDVATVQQRRLVRSLVVALVTQVGAVSAVVTLPTLFTVVEGVTSSPTLGKPHPAMPDGALIAVAFAPPIALPLVALGALFLARSRQGTPDGDGDGGGSATEAAAPLPPTPPTFPTPSVPAARQPGHRLALLSVVTGLYVPVAAPLAVVLYGLALAALGPPVCQPGSDRCLPGESPVADLLRVLALGLVLLIIPAVGVAIVSGHAALSRLPVHAAPTRWRILAWWGLVLGDSTFPVLTALYMLAVLTGAGSGE
jgi:hypothetical protein